MKTIVYYLSFLAVLPCLGQTTNAPASTTTDASLIKRDELIAKIHLVLDDASVSVETKAKLAPTLLKLVDSDTSILKAQQNMIIAEKENYDAFRKVIMMGILPDGVKPDPGLYPYVKTTSPAFTATLSPLIGQKVSLTLKDGTVKTGTLAKIYPEGVSILTDDGGGKVLFDSMTDADKARFGYSQEAHDNYIASQAVAAPASVSTQSASTASAAGWNQVTTLSGSSAKNSGPFTITADRWRVKWSLTSSQEGRNLMVPAGLNPDTYAGLFVHAISEDTPRADEQDIVAKTGVGSDTTELRGAGTWHLQVDSANSDWSLVVEEFR